MLRRTHLPTKNSCCDPVSKANVYLRLGATATFLAGLVTASSFGHSAPIRNYTPQQVTNPANTQDPVFHARATGRARPGDSHVDQLLIKFLDLHTAMKYQSAVEVARQIVQLRPEHKDSHYNLACALARLDRLKDALDELKLAIDFGWRDTTHLAIDNDLDSIRHNRRYIVLLKKITKLTNSERVVPGKLRTESWEEIAEDLSKDIPSLMKRYHVPGTSVALVRNGQVVWNTGFGVQDLSTAIPVDLNTVFPAPGSDQLFAAIATMQLYEQGSLVFTTTNQSNQTNQRILPVVLRTSALDQKSEQDGWRVGRLTLFASSKGQSKVRSNESGWVNAIPAASAMTLSLQKDPRVKPQGYFAAIAAVEAISDQPFAEYCQENLFKPIEAKNTWLGIPEAEEDAQIATGYSRLTTPVAQSLALTDSSLNVYCTSTDLARLMTQLMFEPPGQSTTILDNVTIMQLAQVAKDFGFEASVDHAADTLRMQLHKVSHGVGVLMRWYPSQRSGIVVLYNSETGHEAATRIAHQALGGS